MTDEVIRAVAERVLRRLGSPSSGQSSMPIEPDAAPLDYFAPWTGEAFPASPRASASHPSQDQFSIGEAAERAAAVRELVDYLEAEKCTIEKDKPCDHCGTCRTLGF